MRKLSTSEFRLLIFFCAAVFLAANLLAARLWMNSRAGLLREITDLQNRIAEDRSWIAAATDFDSAKDWITTNPPPALAPDQASTALLRTVREAAEAQGLTVTEEALLPAEGTLSYPSTTLQLKLSGNFSGIVQFLYDLQKPGAWRAVNKMNIKSDATPPNALVEMQIRQYFSQPDRPTAPPES